MDSSDDDAPIPKYLGDYPNGAYFAAESPRGHAVSAKGRTSPRSVPQTDGTPVGPRINFDLDSDERALLASGLMEWFGPLDVSESQAVALGFLGKDDMFVEGDRIERAIGTNEPLPLSDWSRALAAVELAFVAEGNEWTTIRGGTDAYWIDLLRRVQRKVPVAHPPLRSIGRHTETDTPILREGS